MSAAGRKIPDQLGASDHLFEDAPLVGTVDLNDGIIALAPAILSLFVTQNLLPDAYAGLGLLIPVVLGILGMSLLLIKPNYLTLGEWVSAWREYRNRPTERRKQLATDGGKPIDSIEVTPDDDTRRITGVHKIHPEYNAVEREDGAMVGMVRFSGANLDTADEQEFRGAIANFANVMNTQLEYDIQLYLPMKRFDPTGQLKMYDERRGDEDVALNPLMQQYLEDRIGWLATMSANSFIREYYAVVSVTKFEVIEQTSTGESGGNGSALKSLPAGEVLHDAIKGATGGGRGMMSDRDIERRQFEELQRRLEELSMMLAVGENNDGYIVEADDAGILLKEFWEGVSVQGEEAEDYIRKRPYVVGNADTNAGDTQ